MSTVPTLLAYEQDAAPKLVRFLPRFVGREREHRMLTLVPELHAWVTSPALGRALNQVKAQTRTHFGQFVKGAQVDDCHFMKRVEDRRRNPPDFLHEVWAISPRFSPPQYRFFGVFVTQNWFLGCTKQSRDWLDEHENRWHTEIDRTLRIWCHFFCRELPHAGAQLYEYISHDAEHCDERW
jgi:hypothetical protein